MKDEMQERKLAKLEDRLVSLFLEEGDPENWTTAEKIEAEYRAECAESGEPVDPKELRARCGQWRGNRYWEKKNADKTLGLCIRIATYRAKLLELQGHGAPTVDDEAKMKEEVTEATKKVQARMKKAGFKSFAGGGRKKAAG